MFVAHAALYAPESSLTVTLPPPVNDGGSLTAFTVMVKVWPALVSTPPLAVPPLSCATTVTTAVPFASGAGVNVSTPEGETAGCDAKSALLLLVAVKVTLCDDSSGGPAE